MRVPELTYGFSQLKDTAGGILELWCRKGQSDDSATTVANDLYTVPDDKILVLTAMALRLNPGAGQIAISATAVACEGVEFFRGPYPVNVSVDFDVLMHWSGELWVPPGETLRATGTFDAATVSNQIRFSAFGFIIPRGNVQQG